MKQWHYNRLIQCFSITQIDLRGYVTVLENDKCADETGGLPSEGWFFSLFHPFESMAAS